MFKFFFDGSHETGLERYFRTEYSKEYQELSKAGVKPSEKLIREIVRNGR